MEEIFKGLVAYSIDPLEEEIFFTKGNLVIEWLRDEERIRFTKGTTIGISLARVDCTKF
jgi:hypothetical protein